MGKDGMEAVQCDLSNTENAPIEEMEINYPVRLLRYELIPDSGGAGTWRGGLGIRREYQFPYLASTTVTVFADRATNPPWGIVGGKEGRGAHFYLSRQGGPPKQLPSKCVVDVGPDEVISFQTPGGGGYGDPYRRDADRVASDVRLGKVSPARAAEDYGVVVDGAGVLDEAATTKLRREGGK